MTAYRFNSGASTGLTLQGLPTELLVKVLFHLDGYTMNSLLEVCPAIKDKCILITDRPQVALFTAPGLRQIQLSELSTVNSRNFIKLYEIEDTAGCLKEAIEQDNLPNTVFFMSLNSFSFIHFATEDQGMPHWTRIIQAINKTRATAEISSCPAGDIVTQNELDLVLTNDCPTLLDTSTSLVFKTVDYLQDLTLPNVEALTVVFSTHFDVPVMRNLDLPQLKKLVIVYPDAFPEMYNIEAPFGSKEERKDSLLEFVHLPSMRSDLKVLLDYKHQSLPEATDWCLGGPKRWDANYRVKYIPLVLSFLHINVTGGPFALYRHLTPVKRVISYKTKTNYNLTHLHIKRTTIHECRSIDGDDWLTVERRYYPVRLYLTDMRLLSYESSAMTGAPYSLRGCFTGLPFDNIRRLSRQHGRIWLFMSLVLHHSNTGYADPSGLDWPPFQEYKSIGDNPMYESQETDQYYIKESLREWGDLTEFHDRAHCAVYGVNFDR